MEINGQIIGFKQIGTSGYPELIINFSGSLLNGLSIPVGKEVKISWK